MKLTIQAEPFPFVFDPDCTALIVIDMQRDFLEKNGFGASLGNDVTLLRKAVEPVKAVLRVCRENKMLIIHTREGHLPSGRDLFPAKRDRGNPDLRIGERGPMGPLLIRGSEGHGIIPELAPQEDEVLIDKPGKGAFYGTNLETVLRASGISNLIVCGVTTEICVQSTVREANDRGFDCLVLSDGTASYFPDFHRYALEMIKAQGGILGWVGTSENVISALAEDS